MTVKTIKRRPQAGNLVASEARVGPAAGDEFDLDRCGGKGGEAGHAQPANESGAASSALGTGVVVPWADDGAFYPDDELRGGERVRELFKKIGRVKMELEITQPVLARGVEPSMDARRRALDNVFIERLWRTVNDKIAYLKSCCSEIEPYTQLSRFSGSTKNGVCTAPLGTKISARRLRSIASRYSLPSSNDITDHPPDPPVDSCSLALRILS
jgi:hypothetical protein